MNNLYDVWAVKYYDLSGAVFGFSIWNASDKKWYGFWKTLEELKQSIQSFPKIDLFVYYDWNSFKCVKNSPEYKISIDSPSKPIPSVRILN